MEYNKQELEAGIKNIALQAEKFEKQANDDKFYNTDYGRLMERMSYELRQMSSDMNNFGGW